jgi:hypothetical protein
MARKYLQVMRSAGPALLPAFRSHLQADIASAQQPGFGKTPQPRVYRAERSAETLSLVGHAVLAVWVE